jgi:23S rRNA (uridine2552-2'-O)-methyltransferase
MSRSKSSTRWLQEHFNDPFVKRAKVEGLRSRAAYKLEELLQKDVHIRPGMVIVDLGSAPGSWSQMAATLLKGKGRVVAMDILPMDPIEGVDFLQGDFLSDDVAKSFSALLNGAKADLVLCDMAPNMSGVAMVDQTRSMVQAELALDFARVHAKPGATFLIKLFMGEGFDAYVKELRKSFANVKVKKPDASRDRSREVYALAQKMKGD